MNPERWFGDDKIWLIQGTVLKLMSRSGQELHTQTLPAEVEDLDWGLDGFFLCYRTPEFYVEKRSYAKGAVIWSYGSKVKKGEAPGWGGPFRICLTDDRHLALITGTRMDITLLDGTKGSILGQVVFAYQQKEAPALLLPGRARGPLVLWGGKGVLFNALPGSALPHLNHAGMVLLRYDLPASEVDFLPVAVSEQHLLLGVQDGMATFIAPQGGLVSVPVK